MAGEALLEAGFDVENPDSTQDQEIMNLGARLNQLYSEYKDARRETENDWISDLRQFSGQYDPETLARLAEADVFFALGRSRREALWEAKSIRANKPLPLFSGDLGDEFINEPTANLPVMTTGEEIIEDYAALRFSLRAHPIALLRSYLTPVN